MEIYGDGEGGEQEVKMEDRIETTLVFMWGYLPGALPQRSPLLSPTAVRLPPSIGGWKDVCGGGCGFAMAISDTGKLITWGATDDLGQSYVTSGKHGEMPEPFLLPTEAAIVQSDAGWAHCVTVTETKAVYTWGWKECVPSGKVLEDTLIGLLEKDAFERQVSPSKPGGGAEASSGGEESTKRRRTLSSSSNSKQAAESTSLSALPCLVTLQPGVIIASVAAGGRHTLALSDMGQVWGWGYGGEGQLGLGYRTRVVPSPHPVPCIDPLALEKRRSTGIPGGSVGSEPQGLGFPGTYVKGITCGGRHSAVITDAGALLTFGWGLYGQCGQGTTDDELSPTCVSSLLDIKIQCVAAGLWHTVCISADGDIYAFGGNQFGQLGTGSDQAEVLPRLLDAPCLENEHARIVSCGARHSTVVTENCKVFCWGWNKYGQLGLGDAIDRNIPVEVSTDGFTAKNVACGWWHTLLLAESPT